MSGFFCSGRVTIEGPTIHGGHVVGAKGDETPGRGGDMNATAPDPLEIKRHTVLKGHRGKGEALLDAAGGYEAGEGVGFR